MTYLKKANRETLQNMYEIISARESTLTEEELMQFDEFKRFLSEVDGENEKLIAIAADRSSDFRANPKNKKKVQRYNRNSYLKRKARKDQADQEAENA